MKTDEDIAKAEFGTQETLASAAWSPNPKNPPLFLDLPTKGGVVQPSVIARWSANAPLAMADQYIGNLKRLKAFALDVGDKDGLGGAIKELDEILTARNVPHIFEVYPGDHVNHVSDRIEGMVLPFFSEKLAFTSPSRP